MTKTKTHPVHCFTRNALALAIGAGLAAQVQAQDQTENVLEEVIVTASKRETTLQDLSMSVSAISMEAMQRAEINDISRVDQLVPGMQFASSGNEVRIALRGTRQNNVGTEAEQSVGIFEDGVCSDVDAGPGRLCRRSAHRGPAWTAGHAVRPQYVRWHDQHHHQRSHVR